MAGPFTTPVAISVPMENRDVRDNDFKSLNVQDGLEEIDFRRELKEPTGFLDAKNSVKIHYNDATNEIHIVPLNGIDFTYYIAGEEFLFVGTAALVIPPNEGFYVFYLEKNGSITYTYNSVIDYNVERLRFAGVYRDSTNAAIPYFADISSDLSMGWGTKQRISEVERTGVNEQDFLINNFDSNSDGSLDQYAQFGMTAGTVYYNDIYRDIISTPTPVNHWEQTLTGTARIPIVYRTGPGFWRISSITDFPFVENLGGRMFYNEFDGATWSLTEASNNHFVAVYYYATMDPRNPIIGVLGTINSSSPNRATDVNTKNLVGFPNQTFHFLKAVIFQTADSFTNSVKARVTAVSDALDNISADRYMVTSFFGGNAGNGRYLEYLDQADSEEQPLYIPEDSFIRTVTLQASSNISNNRSIAFYEGANLATPRFTLVVPASGSDNWTFDVTELFLKGESVVVKVLNGSIQKPVVRFWIETSS